MATAIPLDQWWKLTEALVKACGVEWTDDITSVRFEHEAVSVPRLVIERDVWNTDAKALEQVVVEFVPKDTDPTRTVQLAATRAPGGILATPCADPTCTICEPLRARDRAAHDRNQAYETPRLPRTDTIEGTKFGPPPPVPRGPQPGRQNEVGRP